MGMFLVHFRSRDLKVLHRQGQFCHVFFTNGSAIVSQNEYDMWTIHLPISLDTDPESLNPEEAIAKVIGGSVGPCPVTVDEILVKSIWRPNICVAERYTSTSGRIFISGDAAHQQIPTGGYGMNTAVGDSFDLGWKLAAVLRGFGSKYLLDAYETERKPVAIRNIERSGVHWKVHREYCSWVDEVGHDVVTSNSPEGERLRAQIAEHVQLYDGENKDHGIELGYRYNGSPVVVPDPEAVEPHWNNRDYVPSTWPGARAPHVFLADGKTSTFDLFGPDYALVDLSEGGKWAARFAEASSRLKIPLKAVHLPNEQHVREIWGRQAVLVRPDDHVAWRSPLNGDAVAIDVEKILKIATGQESSESLRVEATNGMSTKADVVVTIKEKEFTGTVGNVNQNKVDMLAPFQQ